ncbi:hypothetical protein DL89DRAFT_292926 [Linderina pennispora]|uniref:Uncharacterized protein n=1 Tax=Linderina pennispora TaxID=61395 RepID=A0A1Y1W9Q9_9FUNG|nr:uncharacterized protein DL89DRAFT_292926 [Linderina pennispora]ORX70277.1 hypothetical protein DL89DRAFT_292926 [Linderina pennispora]
MSNAGRGQLTAGMSRAAFALQNGQEQSAQRRSLFSMTTVSEYELLDSGRIRTGFDPMRLSLDPPVGDDVSNESKDQPGQDVPSLELLAEMIKEEIRQASGLKQALDKVGIELGGMEERVLNLPTPDKRAKRAKKQVRFTVPDDVRFRWLGIFQAPEAAQDPDEQQEVLAGETTPSNEAADANSETSAPEARGDLQVQQVQDEAPPTADSPHRIRRVSAMAAATVREAGRQETSKEETMQGTGQYPLASNSSIEAVYGGSRPDTREAVVAAEEPSHKDTAALDSSKFATISGRTSRKISAHLFGEQAAADESLAGQQTAESRVHIPKRYSVSPAHKSTDNGAQFPVQAPEPTAPELPISIRRRSIDGPLRDEPEETRQRRRAETEPHNEHAGILRRVTVSASHRREQLTDGLREGTKGFLRTHLRSASQRDEGQRMDSGVRQDSPPMPMYRHSRRSDTRSLESRPSSDQESSAPSSLGERSRSNASRGSSASSQVPPVPRHVLARIGRRGTESDGESPPMPRLPEPPMHGPYDEAVEYGRRRSRKSRRASLMVTINHMLGKSK